MLDENAHEALDGAHDGGVNHDDTLLLALLIHAREVEALRHIHVELDGCNLPLAAERILRHEVELRSVERCLADANKRVGMLLLCNIFEDALRVCPPLFVAQVRIGVLGIVL